MLNDKGGEEETGEHVHRWSLLKDREFYELGDLISRYFVAVQNHNDCPHTDSPLVDSVETIAMVLWRSVKLPDHPIVRVVFMEMLETMGVMAFSAGMRFAADGLKLDGVQPFMTCEIPEQDDENGWDNEVAEGVREWRESLRKDHYLPKPETPEITDEQRAVLEQITGQKLPKDARILLANGGIGIGIPQQEYRPGTYL